MLKDASTEAALQVRLNSPDLLCLVGSKLYGTARFDSEGNCISDTDKRGIVMPPWEYLTTDEDFNQRSMVGEVDGLLWSFKFALKQLISCNPALLEMLFCPPQNIISCTDLGRRLLSIRDAFVCKRFYKRIFGFSSSEWRKCRGLEFEKTERTKTEAEIINDIQNVFGPTFGEDRKEVMDAIIELLYSHQTKKEVPSTKMNGKRKEEFIKYGYCSSSACHSVRLVRQCSELLRTGTITFPRPDAAQLSDIKHGRLKLPEIEGIYSEALADAEKAVKETTLPETPNIEIIREFWKKTLARELVHDVRLMQAGFWVDEKGLIP